MRMVLCVLSLCLCITDDLSEHEDEPEWMKYETLFRCVMLVNAIVTHLSSVFIDISRVLIEMRIKMIGLSCTSMNC